jgi:hypothetical protein
MTDLRSDGLRERIRPVIQMCDALSRNVPKLPSGVEILVATCMAHGRRQFVELVQNFPEECRHVLEMLGEVYRYDAEAREDGLTAEERLRFHQERSGPVMEKLHGWLEAQLAERKTEPNSGLGKAIAYLLRGCFSTTWIHQRHRFDQAGLEDRVVLHRAPACGREHRRCAEAAGKVSRTTTLKPGASLIIWVLGSRLPLLWKQLLQVSHVRLAAVLAQFESFRMPDLAGLLRTVALLQRGPQRRVDVSRARPGKPLLTRNRVLGHLVQAAVHPW